MSIRAVYTPYTAPTSSPQPFSSTSTLYSTPNILADLNMNHGRSGSYTATIDGGDLKERKYPPGLGFETTSQGSPAMSSTAGGARRRSGSFSYHHGNNYASGNITLSTLTSPFTPSSSSSSPSPPRRRLSPYSSSHHFSSSTTSLPHAPPPPSAQGSQSGEFKRSAASGKFDPFGAEALSSVPSSGSGHTAISSASKSSAASSSPYTHYWKYDAAKGRPILLYNAPTPPSIPTSFTSNDNSSKSNYPDFSYTNTPPAQPQLYTIQLPAANQSMAALSRKSPPPPSKPLKTPPAVKRTSDKDARAKLVAGILLNRIYAVGRPMRRKIIDLDEGMYEGKAGYVKSGLSRVVSVEC